MKTYFKVIRNLALITGVLLASGCASNHMDSDNEHAARNRGAVGGAILGATMDALAGDAELAAKGAAAGAAVGGVSGSMKDLDDSRQSERTDSIADGMKKDNRSDAEKRVAELEAKIKIQELEKQLAEMEKQNNNDKAS